MIPIRPDLNVVKSVGDPCEFCNEPMVKVDNQFFWKFKAYSGVACANSACGGMTYANSEDNILKDLV